MKWPAASRRTVPGRAPLYAARVLRRYSNEGAGGYGSPAPGEEPEILAAYVQFWPQPR